MVTAAAQVQQQRNAAVLTPFCTSHCLTAQLAKVAYARAGSGLGGVQAAVSAGGFHVDDPKFTLATAAGALLGLGRLIIAHPDRDDASDDDKLTELVLCIFGVIPDEARRICCTPLPDAGLSGGPGSAA